MDEGDAWERAFGADAEPWDVLTPSRLELLSPWTLPRARIPQNTGSVGGSKHSGRHRDKRSRTGQLTYAFAVLALIAVAVTVSVNGHL